jgi:hypothetical protein
MTAEGRRKGDPALFETLNVLKELRPLSFLTGAYFAGGHPPAFPDSLLASSGCTHL